MDAWVKNGRIVRLELPLNQFGKGGQGRVAARVDIARDAGDVTAPAGAVPVDVAGMGRKLVQSLSGLSGLGGVGGGEGGDGGSRSRVFGGPSWERGPGRPT